MRIAICGHSRSGSTLFYCMLRNTVKGYRFFDTEVSALHAPPGDVITKRPMDCLRWRGILNKWPETQFVIMIRDPRAMLASRHYRFDRYTVSWDHYLAGHEETVKYRAGGLINIANYIRDMLHEITPTPFVVKYEDLVRDPQGVQDALGERFGFEYTGLFEDFHESERSNWPALGGLRPIDPATIDKWRGDPERIRWQFEECPALFDLVEEYGYERDRGWYARL